jgi:hypothetical protein
MLFLSGLEAGYRIQSSQAVSRSSQPRDLAGLDPVRFGYSHARRRDSAVAGPRSYLSCRYDSVVALSYRLRDRSERIHVLESSWSIVQRRSYP